MDLKDDAAASGERTGASSTAVDPTFVDATGGDFHLAASSPLVDAGPSTSTKNDPDGSPNDIGAYGGRHSFGGGW